MLRSLAATLRAVYHQTLAFAYRGDRVECPCCGGRFRAFLPFGVVRRENARCPRCGSLERHRLLWLYLEQRTQLLHGGLTLLHVAPEALLAGKLERVPRLGYLSVDLESPLAMAHMDVTRLGLRDQSLDVILCLHVLEHVADDRAAMGEFLRVLRPGGWAILQSPVDEARAETFEDASVTDPAERERVFGQRDHVRIYGRDYLDRLRDCGFAVEDVPFAASLGPAAAQRYGLFADERITLCRRPG